MNITSQSRYKPCLISIAVGLFVSISMALSAIAHAQNVDSVAFGNSFKPVERAAKLVTVSDTKSVDLKSIKRVALSSFQVQFVTKGAASATSYKIGQSGSANTNLQVTLVGLTPADYQAITDKLHADFTADLKAMNIDVVPTEQIQAAAAYKKMAASGSPAPGDTRDRASWSSIYAPAGLALYGVGSSANPAGMFGAFNAISEVSAIMFGQSELSTELDAALFTVRMVVNFVDTKSSNANWYSRSGGEAKVSWAMGPSITADESSLTITSKSGTAILKLNSQLMIDGAAFKEVKDTTSIAGNVALGLLSLAIGKGGAATAVSKEAVADPEKYRTLVGAGAGAVREMWMERFRAGM